MMCSSFRVLTLACQDHDFSRQAHGNHANGSENVDQLFVLRHYCNSDLFHAFTSLEGAMSFCSFHYPLEVSKAFEQKKQKNFQKNFRPPIDGRKSTYYM